jgi:hypothetical protein
MYLFGLFSFLLLSCGDEGRVLPVVKEDPDLFVKLINDDPSTESLYFRHGQNICYGYWTYTLFSKCKHPFHGTNGDPDLIDYPYAEVKASNTNNALVECEQFADLTGEVPLGVAVLDYKVKLKQTGLFICLARLEVPKYLAKRSPACGLDFNAGQITLEQLGLSITQITAIEGSNQPVCLTCDDIALKDYAGVQNKFYCLVGNYLKLNAKSKQPLSDEEVLMKEEILQVLKIFQVSYGFVLSKDQRDAIEMILARH